jgi:hypothetical protein
MYWNDDLGLLKYKQIDGTFDLSDSPAETFRFFHLLKVRLFLGISNEGIDHSTGEAILKAWHSVVAPDGITLQRAPGFTRPIPYDPMTSDQTIPIICAFGAWNYGAIVQRLEKNLGLTWPNHQPILGDGYACFRRAQGKKSNNFLDSFLWGTVLARCGYLPTYDSGLNKIQWGDKTDVEDDANLIHLFLQCSYTSHTFTSLKAMKFYAKHRDIHNAISRYYGDQPDIYMLYAPVIDKAFYGK